jgi:recombinational DNA repair ATPase RecF
MKVNANILSSVWGACETYRRVLDWMIGYIDTLYVHSTRNYRQLQGYRLSTIYSSLLHLLLSSVYYTLH